MSVEYNISSEDCEAVIARYSDTVYRLAFSRTGSRFDADEIFQEVFLRYIRKKPNFSDEEHCKAWFIKVTINCSKKFVTKFRNNSVEELTDSLPFEQKEDNDLYCELQKLPAKYREIIHLFYYENMPIKEIAKILNRNSSTIRTQLTRAREILKKYIKEDDYV